MEGLLASSNQKAGTKTFRQKSGYKNICIKYRLHDIALKTSSSVT